MPSGGGWRSVFTDDGERPLRCCAGIQCFCGRCARNGRANPTPSHVLHARDADEAAAEGNRWQQCASQKYPWFVETPRMSHKAAVSDTYKWKCALRKQNVSMCLHSISAVLRARASPNSASALGTCSLDECPPVLQDRGLRFGAGSACGLDEQTSAGLSQDCVPCRLAPHTQNARHNCSREANGTPKPIAASFFFAVFFFRVCTLYEYIL